MSRYPSFDRFSVSYSMKSWLEKQALVPSVDSSGSTIDVRIAIRKLFVSKIHEEFWALVDRDFQMYEDIGKWAREEFVTIVENLAGAEAALQLQTESLQRNDEYEIEDYYSYSEKLEKELILLALSRHPVGIVFLLASDGYSEALMEAENEHCKKVMQADDPDNEPEFDNADFADEYEGRFMNHAVSEWINHGFWAHY